MHPNKPERRSRAALFMIMVLLLALAGIIFWFKSWTLILKLRGSRHETIEYGSEWKDPGAEAEVSVKWLRGLHPRPELSSQGQVDTGSLGTYTIKYRAKYGWLSLSADREVTVVDTQPPDITMNGEAELTLKYGGDWTDPGVSARDNLDGDISGLVTSEGAVDTLVPGDYTIHYHVEDSSGNAADRERHIHVAEKPQVRDPDPAAGRDKVIYLTFDDGPGPDTDRLLEILDHCGVKATFFVTDMRPEYESCIAREAAAGHSIGVHSASHDYDRIYAGTEAFWADFEAMEAVIEAQTGSRTAIMRFPGGSSNVVSSFNPGIMTKLAAQAEGKGYVYFDWNVSSGDAGGACTRQQIYSNIVNGVKDRNTSVVLCHDTSSLTIDAIEETIRWCKEEGYTFLPLSPGSYTAHHLIAN